MKLEDAIKIVQENGYHLVKKTDKQVSEAILFLVNTLVPHYQTVSSFLTGNQFCLLKAIANAEIVMQPLSNDFIKRHDLPSPSSIKTALDVLLDKELVYAEPDGYIVYDRFLNLWLQRMR